MGAHVSDPIIPPERKGAVCHNDNKTSIDLQHLWSLAQGAVPRHTVARQYRAYPRARKVRSRPSWPAHNIGAKTIANVLHA